MSDKHREHWDEIMRLVKDDLYSEVHKFYSQKGGWLRLTDKLGQRYEIVYGNTVQFFKSVSETVAKVNNYSPHWQRKLTRYTQNYS